MKLRTYVGSAALGAAVLAGMGKHGPAAAGGGDPLSAAAVPAGGSGSQQAWAGAFLAAIGEPRTTCNVNAIVAWEVAEGGGVTNSAAYNPLNTARTEPGSWPIPGDDDGVQAYPSYQEGLDANVAAITNGLYGGILSALRAGNNAQAVADAVASSPWGTNWYPATC